MPANLPAEAKAKWNRALAAKTPVEKISALEDFLSSMPKHKGTEKLRAQVKRKIALLRLEIEEKRKKRTGAASKTIERAGVSRIVMLGPTNVGRSTLLATVTNAKPEIASHKFTTREPVPGIMQFEDVQFQLIEAPALMPGASNGYSWGSQTLNLARQADALIIMVDLAEDPSDQLRWILTELEKAGITVVKTGGEVEIEKGKAGSGIRLSIMGRLVNCSQDNVVKLLADYGIKNALVRIQGEVTIDDVEEAILESSLTYKPALIVANKSDVIAAHEKLVNFKNYIAGKLQILAISCKNGVGINELGKMLFETLGIIRVYTKEPNEREPSPEPYIAKKGTSVREIARQIHSDLYEGFRYARIFGPSSKYPWERVGANHILEDGDAIEIHAR